MQGDWRLMGNSNVQTPKRTRTNRYFYFYFLFFGYVQMKWMK